MKVIVTPKEILNARKHTCSVCGYYGIWTDGWGYYEILVTGKYNPYEIEFKICSEECQKKEEEEGLISKLRKKYTKKI